MPNLRILPITYRWARVVRWAPRGLWIVETPYDPFGAMPGQVKPVDQHVWSQRDLTRSKDI